MRIGCLVPLQRSVATPVVNGGNRESSPTLVFRAVVIGAILLESLFLTTTSRAGIVVNMSQSGSNVVATLSGSIASLTGATLDQTGTFALNDNLVLSKGPLLGWSNNAGEIGTYNNYSISTIPTDLGTSSTVLSTATSSTASTSMFVQDSSPELWIESSYTLGTAVTGTLTWANTSLSAMGIAPGSYVWSWTGDSITLNVVPEPSTCAMALAGMACGGYTMWRRRKRA